MARAVITIAVDVDRGQDAHDLRSLLVADAEAHTGFPVRVTESTVAVDESLASEDIDE